MDVFRKLKDWTLIRKNNIVITPLVINIYSWNFRHCILHRKDYPPMLKTQYWWKIPKLMVPFHRAGHIFSQTNKDKTCSLISCSCEQSRKYCKIVFPPWKVSSFVELCLQLSSSVWLWLEFTIFIVKYNISHCVEICRSVVFEWNYTPDQSPGSIFWE